MRKNLLDAYHRQGEHKSREVAFDEEDLEGPCSSSFIESPFGVKIPLDSLEGLEELASMGG